jgi:hypothetical protein
LLFGNPQCSPDLGAELGLLDLGSVRLRFKRGHGSVNLFNLGQDSFLALLAFLLYPVKILVACSTGRKRSHGDYGSDHDGVTYVA